MSRILSSYVFILIILFTISNISTTQEGNLLNDLSSTVVYLLQEDVDIIRINNEMYEIWLKVIDGKKPDSTNIKPYIKPFSGTGFFIYNNKNDLYLVTAAHVAQNISNNSWVILKGPSDVPIKLKLVDIVGSKNISWVIHPTADIAVVKLRPSEKINNNYLQQRFLPLELCLKELVSPPRDVQLTIMGFPLGLGVDKNFSPLTLHTKASSGLVEMNRFDTGIKSTFFLCEDPSLGGYSGAPCFDTSIYTIGSMTTTGGGMKIYGLIHGTISQGGGLTAVVPIKYLFDILQK